MAQTVNQITVENSEYQHVSSQETDIGAGDSFGAGDSSGTGERPSDFVPFPTNESDVITGSYIHHGVLYMEIKVNDSGDYEPYYSSCIRTSNRQIIGSTSMDDSFLKDKHYMLSGRYKPYTPRSGTYDQLKLTLQPVYEKKKERIT